MLQTLGVVQVPPASSLPGLKGNRSFQGKSLLGWVVRRVTDSQRLDGVIVVAPDNPTGQALAELVPPDVPLYLSQRNDPLGQLADALISYPSHAIVRIEVDHPFIDPELIDRLVTHAAEHPVFDYIGYASADGKPTVQSSLGVFAEWCRTKALLAADREAYLSSDRQQVTRYLYTQPKFAARLIPVPAELDRGDVRLRIDSPEDWEHARTIFDALGEEHLGWQKIAGLLEHQPAIRQRMAAMNRSDEV